MMNKEKKVHGVKLLIRLIVRTPDGKILSDTGRMPSKSFLIQFLEALSPLFRYIHFTNATATDGSEDPIIHNDWASSYQFRGDAGINASAYGLVVGTGDTAETNTDYKLETQLTEGTTAGKITHASTVIGAPAVVGANVDMNYTRAFSNATGSTITVKEAGIYIRYSVAGPYYHCIARDVLPAPVEVPDKCSLTVIYTFRTTA